MEIFMYELTEREYEATLKLNAEYRQSLFINKTLENKVLFIVLQEEGPFLLEDNGQEGEEQAMILPVWCHEKFAQAYIDMAKLPAANVQQVSLDVFKEQWIPMLNENKILLGFMPVEGAEFSVDEPKCLEANN